MFENFCRFRKWRRGGNMKKIICTLFIFIYLLMNCCTYWAVSSRQKEIENMVNPLLGKTSEEVIIILGVPTNIKEIGELTIYEYYRSYGTRSNIWVSPTEYTVYGGNKKWEAYDIINLYFKEDIMVKWDAYVQR